MKGSWLRKTAIWALALAVVSAGLLGSAAFFFNGSYLAGRITAAFNDAGYSLVFRQTPVASLFPPRLDFGQIAGTARLGSIAIDFALESGSVEPDLTGLLFGRLELRRLTLNRPVLKLRPAPGAQGSAGNFPEIGQLLVQDAQAEFVSRAGRLLFADLKLAGQNIRPRREMELQCDCVLDWTPPSGASVSGNLAVQTKLRYYAPTLTFREAAVSFTATDNGFLSRYSPLQIHFEGGFDLRELRPRIRGFELSVPDLRLVGMGDFENGRFAGEASVEADLSLFSPLQGRLEFDSPFALDARSLSFTDITLKLGSCTGAGTASLGFAQADAPFSITADLSAGTLDLDEFALAKEKEAAPPALPLAWPTLDFRLAMKGVRKEKLALADLSAAVKGSAGAYRIEKFAASWAEGKITGYSLLDFAGLRFSLASQGKRLNLGKALAQLGVGGFASGNMEYSLRLYTTGSSPEEAIKRVSGSGRLNCENLGIKLPAGVAFFMGRLGRNLPSVFHRARINFRGQDGGFTFSPVSASGPGFEATGSAFLQIASEELSGKFILKALALEFPVSFKGPWGDLSWSFGRSSP